METIVKAYRTYEAVDNYTLASEKRVKEIKTLFKANRRYFGKRLLDIACGGGILGFVAEPFGISYIGIDINPDMIKAASKHAKAIKSKNRFILKDAVNSNLSGRFDTIAIIGNAIGHIDTNEMLKLIENIDKIVHRGSYLIIDYRDMIYLLANGLWKKHYKGKRAIHDDKGADTINGAMLREGYMIKDKTKIKLDHKIWAPFILEPLMKSHGWTLVKRKRDKDFKGKDRNRKEGWNGWLDVYKKVR